jgi:hypothetical protein
LYRLTTQQNIIGPQLYTTPEAPYYRRGLTANLAVLSALAALVVVQGFYLNYLNKRNIRRRIAAGKSGNMVDYSLESSSKWAAMREKQAAQDLADGHVGPQVHNANAFLDM